MPNSLGPQATKASWALFEGLFLIAALVAVFATFIAISGVNPDNPSSGATPWLLSLNLVLIVVLAIIVGREFLQIQSKGRGENKGRLAQRFVLLFGFSALVPSMIVAIFLGAVFTRGLDNWVGERVDTVMTQNREMLQDYRDNFDETFSADARQAATDVEDFARAVALQFAEPARESDANAERRAAQASERFSEGLRQTLAYRGMLTIAVLGNDGVELIAQESVDTPVLIPPAESVFAEANKGDAATRVYPNRGVATSLVKISEPVDGYVYAAKAFDKRMFSMLSEANTQIVQYENAKRRGGRLQTIFAIGYAQITALILLLAGRLGLEAAGRITAPIGRLANAAHAVRDGDLTARVPVSGYKDEVYALSQSFNAMTTQLSEQRGALVQAREDAEDRRQFVETLLAEVSAGVIRVDSEFNVSLANRSAGELLGVDHITPGVTLESVAPIFLPHARDTLTRGAAVDASIDLNLGGEILHIRLKTAPDPAGGCVITFDDTTRLINAQRQLAWRDVARRIAHEIRNPLTPIMLSTERLKRRYSSKIDDTDGVFEKCIETILRQVGDIGRMVEEFSSFARMPKPSVAPFDLEDLLRQASFSQSVVSPDIDFSVSTELSGDALSYVGDDRLLGQAFGNLMKNASEAIDGLSADNEVSGAISVEISPAPNGILVTIDDNGPGFPEEVRNQLLEPYVTTREKGTGLGLAIVNRVIADHGGSISLQDRPDGQRGARVKVWLPNVDPATDETNDLVENTAIPLARLPVEEPTR